MDTTVNPSGEANLRASISICCANSRVGCEDDGVGTVVAPHVVLVETRELGDVDKQWEEECCCFSGTCYGDADKVSVLQRDRYCSSLNG